MIETEKEKSPEQILTGKSVLLVDDNQNTLESLRTTFNSVNAKATAINNPKDALIYLADNPNFDIGIIDLIMPFMNGCDFLKKIIDNPGLTTCKAFILHTSTISEKLNQHLDTLREISEQNGTGIKIGYLYKGNPDKVLLNMASNMLTNQQ